MESFNDWPADFSGPFHRSGPGGSGPHARRGMRRGGPGHNHGHNHNHGHGPGPDNGPAQGGWGWDPRFGSAPTPGFGPEAGPHPGPHAHPQGRRHGHPHPQPHSRRRGRGRGGRAGRGDLRAVIVTLLAQEPMHGYQLITQIKERTGGNWVPSPGTVYPTLSMLEDEGMITISAEGGRKMATLTDEGRQLAEDNSAQWSQILDAYAQPEDAQDPAGPAGPPWAQGPAQSPAQDRQVPEQLRAAFVELGKLGHLVQALDEAQLEQAVAVLREAQERLKQL